MDNVEDLVNKLGTLSVVALGLVVSDARLTRYEVVTTKRVV
jgi:hypothetical protein